MADLKLYEDKLTEAIKETAITSSQVRKYANALEDREDCRARIIVWLAHKFNVPRGTAEAYIDMRTGEFRSGPLMSYCLDPELKGFYAKLKDAITTIKNSPYTSTNHASDVLASKQKVMDNLVLEIRKTFGDDKARQIVTRARERSQKETGIAF